MGQPVAYVPSGVPQPGNDQSWVAWLPAALFIPVSIPIPATGSGPWHPYLPGLTPSLPCRHPCADGRPRPASFCIPLAAVSSRCSPSLRITPVNGGHCRGVRLSLEPRGESSLGGWRGFKLRPGRGIRAKGAEWGISWPQGHHEKYQGVSNEASWTSQAGAWISRIYQGGLWDDIQHYVFNGFLLINATRRKKFTHVFIP